MNERGVEVLVAAALAGVPQIQGALKDNGEGRCAMGVLADAKPLGRGLVRYFGLAEKRMACPECGATSFSYLYERGLIIHLNDRHGWDFLAIARKLGPAVELHEAEEARREGGDHA